MPINIPTDFDATNWNNLQPLYDELRGRVLKCAGCLEQLILDVSEIDSAVDEAGANLYINMTCHTDDEGHKNAYLGFVENIVPKVKQARFEIDQRIASSPFVDDLPAKYSVYLRDVRTDVEIFREENVPLQTEETKLDQQYEETCGDMTVQFDGEEKTMPQMMKYMERTDRPVREAAFRGMWDRRLQDTGRISGIFDELIKLRHRIARNAGFDNFRDYQFKAMHRFDYTPAHCEAFHRAAEEVCVPLYRDLNAQRARTLKVDTLRPWDLDVDVRGRSPLTPFDGADDLVEKSSRLFHRMEASLGVMFDTMRSGDCLDLETRKGKAPGGYQYWRDRSRRPFIFMNAAGLQRDLETMVHEAGHAFHSLLSQHQPIRKYRDYPTEFAEVASMSMELTAHPFLDEFYDEDEAKRARRIHLEQLARLLPWIATIDAFQHWIYTNPDHTRDDRTQYWLDLNARFGPAVNWNGIETYLEISWQRQGHLFGVPFYYIEYGIAQLGALQLWIKYKNDPKQAIAKYKEALSLGGSRPLPELFKAAELKFDFSPAMMRNLMDEVKKELAALPV